MTAPGVHELRRVAAAVAQLPGETVRDVAVRSDLRQLRLEFVSGLILLIGADQDEAGRPRFAVDVVATPAEAEAKHQIEVRFD